MTRELKNRQTPGGPRNISKCSSREEDLRIDLLLEYEDRLLANDNPSPMEYFRRYSGTDPDEFKRDLNLTTLLVVDGAITRDARSQRR